MLEIDEVYEKLVEKFGDVNKAAKLLSFYFFLKNYGLNEELVKEIFPEKLFDENKKALSEAGINLETDYKLLPELKTYFYNEDEEIISRKLEKIDLVNLEWLRYFVVFYETGNSLEAANRLNITPQALSKAILGIEKHFNLNLLKRNKHFRGFTLAGHILFEKAKTIFINSGELENFFKSILKVELEGELIIASTGLWSKYLLPDLIGSFLDRYPKLLIKSNPPQVDIENQIIKGNIEIGFTTMKPEKTEIDYIDFNKTRYIIAGKPQAKKLWHELSYIATLQDQTGNGWPEQEFPRKLIINTSVINIDLELAKTGLGALYVPEMYVRKEIENGSLAELAEPPFEKYLNLYVIWNKYVPLTEAAQRFLNEAIKKARVIAR